MISPLFEKLRTNLELTPTFDALVQQKHNAVRGVVEKALPGSKTKLIGSVARKTRIQPRSEDVFDIDILVEMGNFYSWRNDENGVTTGQAKQKLKKALVSSPRYEAMNPTIDEPTILFEHANGVRVELVPAYRDMIGLSASGVPHAPIGRAYWIPKNGRWELVDYDLETDYTSVQNKETNGYLVPVLKMLKALKRETFPDMSSFYLEILTAKILPILMKSAQKNGVVISYPYLLHTFVGVAPIFFDAPLSVPGSNSREMLLSPEEQAKYKKTFDILDRYIASFQTEAALSKHITGWREVLGEVFPSNL